MPDSNAMDPGAAMAAYTQAAALYKAGRYHEALPMLEAVHRMYPNQATVAQALEVCRKAVAVKSRAAAPVEHVPAPPPPLSSARNVDQESFAPAGRIKTPRRGWRVLAAGSAAVAIGVIVLLSGRSDAPPVERSASRAVEGPEIPAFELSGPARTLLSYAVNLPETALNSAEAFSGFLPVGEAADCRVWRTPFGGLIEYAPRTITGELRLAIVVSDATPAWPHGLEKTWDLVRSDTWMDFADQTGFVLAAPVSGPNADVTAIIETLSSHYQARYGFADQRLLLIGESVNAESLLMFCRDHPERVLALSLSHWPIDEPARTLPRLHGWAAGIPVVLLSHAPSERIDMWRSDLLAAAAEAGVPLRLETFFGENVSSHTAASLLLGILHGGA